VGTWIDKCLERVVNDAEPVLLPTLAVELDKSEFSKVVGMKEKRPILHPYLAADLRRPGNLPRAFGPTGTQEVGIDAEASIVEPTFNNLLA
jgi:hypothetical protein